MYLYKTAKYVKIKLRMRGNKIILELSIMTTLFDLHGKAGLKQYVWKFTKYYKLYIALLIVIAVVAGGCEISVDYKIKEIIDAISSNNADNLRYLLFLFVLYKFLHHGSYFAQRCLDIKYKPAILEYVVKDIYSKTIGHSLHWFDSHLSGETSSKIEDFQDGMVTLITCLFKTFHIIVTIIITLFFILHVNVLTGLVLGLFVIIYTPIIYLLLKRQLELQESYVNAKQEAMGIINDSIANIFGIKVIGDLISEFKLKLTPAINKWRAWDYKTRQFDAYYVDNADTLMVVTLNAVQIYLLAFLFKNGDISAGSFAFIAMITLKIHAQLDAFLENLLFNVNPKMAQIKSSYSFINTKLDVEDKENAKALAVFEGSINYQNVHFSYGENGKLVLHDFNLKIRAGERLGIVGTSGAGKTTMIKCLLRYFDVTEGGIFLGDQDIRDITQDSLRKLISIIPQDITMFHRSIMDNLKLAKYDATEEEIISACIKARIHNDIIAMPQGYNTIVGERGVKLSGGQRQRVAIARAILKNAPILILDEATSSLDTHTEQLIQKSINELLDSSGATVIAIAHRLSTLKHTDRIIVLDKGKLVEDGTHIELLAKTGLYKHLWDAQVGGFLGDEKVED
ncbi:putative ABC transporter ATP-binding protein [Holospora undulata HU1]|uniref:Putative ABC transporter ATP-binding protein n=1 Tax=Holospora undulata HU1 TaxID=1321371 RepID=A0A061JG43_9PROT|nr:putative ABC transporter ATP-binding protein [Holospora undulata HU1]